MTPDSFVDPATGAALEFGRAVTSGLSVGVPGTPATWAEALDRWGHLDLAEALAPECATAAVATPGAEGPSTTHLVTADRWGDVVSHTVTIEQTGGSGSTVPGRGFLLNNELTDFDIAPPAAGEPLPANAPDGGKCPRSSMAPTIVLDGGKPLLAVGSPGGATIITTVLQTLVNRLDPGMTLPEAVAAPRISQRNSAATEAEPAFLDGPLRAELEAYGQTFRLAPATFASAPEIGRPGPGDRRRRGPGVPGRCNGAVRGGTGPPRQRQRRRPALTRGSGPRRAGVGVRSSGGAGAAGQGGELA